MFRTFCILTILFPCIAVQAQDATTPNANTEPKSLAAKQAETKFNLDMQRLDAEYQQKAAAIKQAYVDNLKNALKALAKSDNPDSDEIAKLSAKIKEVQATVQHSPRSQPKLLLGIWNDVFNTGTRIVTFGKDGTVYVGKQREQKVGFWIQEGPAVYVMGPGGTYEKYVFTVDTRSMEGYNEMDGHRKHSLTYIGRSGVDGD